MRPSSIELLTALVNTPSPPGHESRLQRLWLDHVRPFADETFSDSYGNTVAVLNKGGSPRLMLAAHADEIGMAVNFVSPEGFIYVRKLGGIDAAITRAQRVTIHTRNGPVKGVVGNIAPHLTKEDGERKVPKISDLFIDIGARKRKEAEKRVQIGDPITLTDEFDLLHEDLAVARGFDNRVGVFALAETLRLLFEKKQKLHAEISAVSTIMEEVGLFGARQIAYSLKPDLAIVIDVTHATDCPNVNQTQHGDVRLGQGPAITHGGGCHPGVVDRLEKVAKSRKIKLQHEAVSSTSGTDTDVIFWTRGGIPSALVSLPNRYMHSPVEMIHLHDVEQIPDLLAAFALSLKGDDYFKVKI